jgi:hypothetical protein
MNRNLLVCLGLVSVASLLGSVAACSSTTTTTEVVDGGTAEGGTKDSGTKDAAISEPDSGTTTNPDTACAAEATRTACGTCCITNHQAGAKIFQDALLACGCHGTGAADGGAGECATACAATACAATPKTPDATCNTCLQGSVASAGSCIDVVVAACTGSSDCVAQQKCIGTCKP